MVIAPYSCNRDSITCVFNFSFKLTLPDSDVGADVAMFISHCCLQECIIITLYKFKHVTIFLRQLYYGTTDPNKQHWDIYCAWSRSFALLGNTENISDVVDRRSQGTRLRKCEFVGLHYFVREGISVTSALKIEIYMMISQHTCVGKM